MDLNIHLYIIHVTQFRRECATSPCPAWLYFLLRFLLLPIQGCGLEDDDGTVCFVEARVIFTNQLSRSRPAWIPHVKGTMSL